jgi:hypothetical protein
LKRYAEGPSEARSRTQEDCNARMKEIAAIIDEIKGKTKETKKESREFVSALELLQRSAQSGYDQAAAYFAKLAEESAKVRKEINSYLYDNEEVWTGGREAWEDFADDMDGPGDDNERDERCHQERVD